MSFDGDDAVAGANADSENGESSGSAYVYRGLDDCNGNDRLDACDFSDGSSNDCNISGYPDECETIGGGDFDDNAEVDLLDHLFLMDCLKGPNIDPLTRDPVYVSMCLDAFDMDNDGDIDLRSYPNNDAEPQASACAASRILDFWIGSKRFRRYRLPVRSVNMAIEIPGWRLSLAEQRTQVPYWEDSSDARSFFF